MVGGPVALLRIGSHFPSVGTPEFGCFGRGIFFALEDNTHLLKEEPQGYYETIVDSTPRPV